MHLGVRVVNICSIDGGWYGIPLIKILFFIMTAFCCLSFSPSLLEAALLFFSLLSWMILGNWFPNRYITTFDLLNSDDLGDLATIGWCRIPLGRSLLTNVYIKTLIKSLWFKTFIKNEIKIIFQVYVEYKTKIN